MVEEGRLLALLVFSQTCSDRQSLGMLLHEDIMDQLTI